MHYYLHHICISISSINQQGNSATGEKQLTHSHFTHINIMHILVSFWYKGEEMHS